MSEDNIQQTAEVKTVDATAGNEKPVEYVSKEDFNKFASSVLEAISKNNARTEEKQERLAIDIAADKLKAAEDKKQAQQREQDVLKERLNNMYKWENTLKKAYPDYFYTLTDDPKFAAISDIDKVAQYKIAYVISANKEFGEFSREDNNRKMTQLLNSRDVEEKEMLADALLPALEELIGATKQSRGRDVNFAADSSFGNQYANYEVGLPKNATQDLTLLRILQRAASIRKDEGAEKHYNNIYNEALRRKESRIRSMSQGY